MIPDDRLRLVFTCCHPALAREAQVALTLRLVCGVATAEIAHAFLVSEPTMAARVTRAKKKIAAAGIPYVVPDRTCAARLDTVLTVVHLLSTTGHTAPSGEQLARVDLAERALDLARMLRLLLPDEREVARPARAAARASARAATRVDDARPAACGSRSRTGSLWDRGADRRGRPLIVGALRAGPPGRFTLQAAIAACTPRRRATRRPTGRSCCELYDVLLRRLAVAGRRAQPRGGGGRGRGRGGGAGGGRGARARRPPGRATATSRRPRPTCCAASAATRRRARPTATRCALTENATERAFLEPPLRRSAAEVDLARFLRSPRGRA